MQFPRFVGVAGLLAGAFLLMPGPAGAQPSPVAGSIEATSHAVMPEDVAIRVRQPDARTVSADITNLFLAGLHDRGRKTAGGNAYILDFQLSGDPADALAPRPKIELRGEVGPSGQDDAEVLMRLRLGKRNLPGRQGLIKRMAVTVRDSDNVVVWEAQADIANGATDAFEVAKTVVPEMLDRLGRTVFSQRFP